MHLDSAQSEFRDAESGYFTKQKLLLIDISYNFTGTILCIQNMNYILVFKSI